MSVYYGVCATNRNLQRPIRNRGRDKKFEYEPPQLQGAKDLRMDEIMEHLHPNRVTSAHPFPLKAKPGRCRVIAMPESGLNPLPMSNSLLGAYTSQYPLLDGPSYQNPHSSRILSSTQPSFQPAMQNL